MNWNGQSQDSIKEKANWKQSWGCPGTNSHVKKSEWQIDMAKTTIRQASPSISC